jgi:putative zinc finger protein
MDRQVNGDPGQEARSRPCTTVLSTDPMPEPATSPCDDLIAFVDGELDPERAAAFREHLRTCEVCQIGLVEAVQLSARLSELPPRSKT